LENASVKGLAPMLKDMAREWKADFPSGECLFDPKWSRNRGRLRIAHAEDTAPELIAANMKALIERTEERLTKALEGTLE
jgi:hypothetical protein